MKYILLIFLLTGCGKSVNKDAPTLPKTPVSPPTAPLPPNQSYITFANYSSGTADLVSNFSTPIDVNEDGKVRFLEVSGITYVVGQEEIKVYRDRNSSPVYICSI